MRRILVKKLVLQGEEEGVGGRGGGGGEVCREDGGKQTKKKSVQVDAVGRWRSVYIAFFYRSLPAREKAGRSRRRWRSAPLRPPPLAEPCWWGGGGGNKPDWTVRLRSSVLCFIVVVVVVWGGSFGERVRERDVLLFTASFWDTRTDGLTPGPDDGPKPSVHFS